MIHVSARLPLKTPKVSIKICSSQSNKGLVQALSKWQQENNNLFFFLFAANTPRTLLSSLTTNEIYAILDTFYKVKQKLH